MSDSLYPRGPTGPSPLTRWTNARLDVQQPNGVYDTSGPDLTGPPGASTVEAQTAASNAATSASNAATSANAAAVSAGSVASIADEPTAEAGTSNTTSMTPLRTAQAIVAQGLNIPITLRNGTTAVALRDRLGYTVTPYDFGAVRGHENDGTGTDQAPFINEAIQAVGAAGGGTVRIPPAVNGAWLIKSQILINVSNVTVEGVGGAVSLYDTRTGGNLFQIGDSSHSVYFVDVVGFYVSSPANKTSGYVFSMTNCNWTSVRKIHANAVYSGVALTNQYNNTSFEEVEFVMPGATSGSGFYVFIDPTASTRGDSLYMKHCIVQASNAGSYGYIFDGYIQTAKIVDCQALGTHRGLQILNSGNNTAGKVPSFMTFDNFQTDRAVDASVIVDTGYRLEFINCDIQNTSGAADSPYPQGGADGTAFQITNGRGYSQPNDVQIIGGRIGNSQISAFFSNGYLVSCVGVTFQDASKSGNNQHPVVEVGASAYANLFTNCKALGLGRANYGFEVDSGAQNTGFNMCFSLGNYTAPTLLSGTNTKADTNNNYF